jgi:hypothetical protein
VTFGWLGPSSTEQVSPLQISLLSRALIDDFEVTGDSRAVVSITLACDYIMSEGWDEDVALGVIYELNPTGFEGYTGIGNPVLNNFVCPMFAWLAVQTRNQTYMDFADKVFAGCAINGGIYDGITAKQYNQRHTWAFQYLDWREAFYAAAPKRLKLRIRA